jgi:hypothetical protein
MCHLAHPEGGGDADMISKRCHPGAREALAHERSIAPPHLASPRSVAQPDESLHPIHLPAWTGRKDDLGMTANRPAAGMLGTPKRSFLKALLASPLLATASVAQASQPLRVGYNVNGPDKSIFEECFELGMRKNGFSGLRDRLGGSLSRVGIVPAWGGKCLSCPTVIRRFQNDL